MNDYSIGWIKKASRLRAKLLIATLLVMHGWTATAAPNNDYAGWYQIEIIVFALNKPLADDEEWPIVNLSYPAEMIGIGPNEDETLAPTNLMQLEQILAHEELLGDEEETQPRASVPATKYLFAPRSRFKVNVPDNGRESTASDELVAPGTDTEPDPTTTPGDDPPPEGDLQPDQAEILDLTLLFETTAPQAFRTIAAKERLLNTLARSINRSSLYRLLLHNAWLQPVVTKDKAMPILIQAGKHYDNLYEVDGTISISRSRFLHVNTNLLFTKFASKYEQQSIPITLNLAPEVAKKYPQVLEWESQRRLYSPLSSHLLQQSRRMRSSSLHFIDHPYFGILLRVENFDYQPEAKYSDLSLR